ncbi:MAG: sigma-54 dependent transcriptional regulator [Pseudomonadota bacterium]
MNQARLLVVEDDLDLREAISETLAMAGYRVAAADDGYQALDILDGGGIAMVISDVQMHKMDGHTLLKHIKARQPQLPVVLMTAYGSVPKAVEAMREGACDYLVKPFAAEVIINMVSRYVAATPETRDFVAMDEESLKVKALAAKVAKSDATILITGESGVGKEVLARFIHDQSDRAKMPFVAINCAAIPENMLESTLFGYEKGAFTGAYKSSPGKFEQAQGGTLLLDEITEMELGLQAKLLRVLQEREVERLGGGGEMINLDVRVLATTNRDMRAEVEAGNFREDLYYRLNVFPIHLPPLRQRAKDILPLAEVMLRKLATQAGKPVPQLSDAAREILLAHPWPGNVRELDNVMQRAVILHQGDVIEAEDIHCASPAGEQREIKPLTAGDGAVTLGDDLRHHEYRVIIEALEKTHGSRKKVADLLGISPRTLRYKLAKMREDGIEVPE